jgi:predicted TPR repeat methyltransferase
VAHARENCRALSHVEFHVADIRNGFPGDGFDLIVFSDVLYYLSPREIDVVLGEAAQRIAPGGTLLVANEWNQSAKGLTPPAYSFARLDASPAWQRTEFLRDPFGEIELSMGIYRRVEAT